MANTSPPLPGRPVVDNPTPRPATVASSSAAARIRALERFREGTIGRPVRVAGAGSSQYSRCMSEASISSAYIKDQKLYITLVASTTGNNFMTGMAAFCVVPRMQVHGPVTFISDTQVVMDAPGFPDVAVNSDSGYFLTFTGTYTAASWFGRLHARYGAGMEVLSWTAKHGDTSEETERRIPATLAQTADIFLYEPGWGNSLKQAEASGESFESFIKQALENLRQVCAAFPLVVIHTPPAPDQSGGAYLPETLGRFVRLNNLIKRLPALFPNLEVVSLEGLISPVSPIGDCIAGIHSDELHFTPKGAMFVFNAYAAVLDKYIPRHSLRRVGAIDVWANGNRQLFDGLLLDTTGWDGGAPAGFTGKLDLTMSYSKAGGSATCNGNLVTRANGLTKWVGTWTGMSGTHVSFITIRGATGALLKDRLVPGRTYRVCVSANIGAPTSGSVKAVSIIASANMSGIPGHTGDRLCWTGRSQQGAVEGGGNVFPQVDAESHEYTGKDFTVPASATAINDFYIQLVVQSGSANSAVVVELEDISIRDVTDEFVQTP